MLWTTELRGKWSGQNFDTTRKRRQTSSKLVDILINVHIMPSMRADGLGVGSDQQTEEWVKLIREAVSSLRFGVVQIVVHNAKVVQIEKTEKVRLDQGH